MSLPTHPPTAGPTDSPTRADSDPTSIATSTGAPAGTGHRVVDHTSELELELWAPDWPTLLAEAGRALAEISLRGAPLWAEGPTRLLEVTSWDREALLVDWLNELLYRAEAELWLACDFTDFEAAETRLWALARGTRVDEAPAVVKAATLHGVAVRETDDGLSATVILDV